MTSFPVVRRNTLPRTLLILAVSLTVLVAVHGWVRDAPFDTETVHRFILPFRFTPETRQLTTVLGESLEWNITRQFYSLSFLADYYIWGTDAKGYHVTDMILTALCALLAWQLIAARCGALTASVTLLFWLAHAAQGWSMLTFTGRNDRIMLLFFLFALSLLDRGMVKKEKRLLISSIAVFALGAFAKEAILSLVPVLFLWCALAAGEGIRLAFLRRKAYWIALVGLCCAYLLVRTLLGASAPDDVPLAGFRTWLLGTGTLYSLLLPGGYLLDAVLVGIVGIAVFTIIPFLRILPRATRFGAAAVVISILPIPLFWVQPSFTWIPALWAALALSALVIALQGRLHLTGWKRYPLPVLLAFLLSLWGHSAGKAYAHDYLLLSSAVELVERENGHFTLAPALRQLPGLRDMLADQGGRTLLKTHAYISAMVSLRFGVEEVVLTGPDGAVLECAPRWR